MEIKHEKKFHLYYFRRPGVICFLLYMFSEVCNFIEDYLPIKTLWIQ